MALSHSPTEAQAERDKGARWSSRGEAGFRISLSRALTRSAKRGRAERSFCQQSSISWCRWVGQSGGGGSRFTSLTVVAGGDIDTSTGRVLAADMRHPVERLHCEGVCGLRQQAPHLHPATQQALLLGPVADAVPAGQAGALRGPAEGASDGVAQVCSAAVVQRLIPLQAERGFISWHAGTGSCRLAHPLTVFPAEELRGPRSRPLLGGVLHTHTLRLLHQGAGDGLWEGGKSTDQGGTLLEEDPDGQQGHAGALSLEGQVETSLRQRAEP
ncbi:hypothetical protein F7725_006733 [Dissostichus mawsoni]|uniref:Uncharacterized protein n=1 Tax=Dissostichus mawsoni TaxID=36200 RepID=A0A7J5XVD9_DISMA|nr:hypothetical protein F7725_006733 [Dissostichus mawsoni]